MIWTEKYWCGYTWRFILVWWHSPKIVSNYIWCDGIHTHTQAGLPCKIGPICERSMPTDHWAGLGIFKVGLCCEHSWLQKRWLIPYGVFLTIVRRIWASVGMVNEEPICEWIWLRCSENATRFCNSTNLILLVLIENLKLNMDYWKNCCKPWFLIIPYTLKRWFFLSIASALSYVAFVKSVYQAHKRKIHS